MSSSSGRYTITFNGEIYNYRDLRLELRAKGYGFISDTDTEVMLAAFEHWGMEKAVGRFSGMFAFAAWDQENEELFLVRDRLGKKPLYYCITPEAVAFSSELESLMASGLDAGGISADAVNSFLRYGCVPGELAIYGNIRKLLPGTILKVSGGRVELLPQVIQYWSPDLFPIRNSNDFDEKSVLQNVEYKLLNAVESRLISDVPLGAFLSGGIDSSLVVAMMQEIGGSPVETFCIGFSEGKYDESQHAASVAKHIGTRHHTLLLDAKRGLELATEMSSIYGEPFADVSQIPTVAVSHFARRDLTVSLSGDGGDELFSGYTRYQRVVRAWSVMSSLPVFLRRIIAGGVGCISPRGWDRIARPIEVLMPRFRSPTSPGDRLHKLASVMNSADSAELYDHIMSHWGKNSALTTDWKRNVVKPSWRMSYRGGLLDMMMRQDLVAYLPDDILTKVDRASMSASLEVRCPILDHSLVEYALSLPVEYKIRSGQTKWPLRQLLYRRVAREIVDRPKTGFGIPLAEWLRGPWREWAESLLARDAVEAGGVLDPDVVARYWREHTSRVRSWHYYLWDLLMLQSWLLTQSRKFASENRHTLALKGEKF